ncbi:hypothetical protein PG997_014693 [Apiospora hydei]|uniref:Uncharacterized protein n=1 Tax=Apiospora hydei TaxID=1337664 RepID=A0ABR1UUJ6_9PEZI
MHPIQVALLVGSLLAAEVPPLTDFDTDGCYFTAAIGPGGTTNPGLSPIAKGMAAECRDNNRLESNNLYSRSRCNNGWCAIMYEYYFEKDQTVWGSYGIGHNHDWENIVVFAQGDDIKRVAPSCHGKYENAKNDGFLRDGTHAKMVYHKDGAATHCWRFANDDDDKRQENYTKQWGKGSLRDVLFKAWNGGVGPKFWDKDDKFTNTLRSAAGNSVPGFDPAKDE